MKIELFILLKIVGVWELTVHITQHPCNIFKYFNYFLFEKLLSIKLDLLAKVRVLLKATKVKSDGLMLPFHFFSPSHQVFKALDCSRKKLFRSHQKMMSRKGGTSA